MRAFLALLGLLACTSLAARIPIAELGLSVDVPQGWRLSRTAVANWQLEDTVLLASGDSLVERRRGFIQLEAMAVTEGLSASAWAKEDAYAWRLFLENNPCYGWVFRHDSTLVDGRFAMFVQGEWAICPDTASGTVFTEVYSMLVRTVAQGKVGWEMSVTSDTLDFAANYFSYRAVLDSIRIDPAFQGLGVHRKGASRTAPFTVTRVGATWNLLPAPGTRLDDLRVLDPAGRSVGRLEPRGDGWTWHAQGLSGPVWVVSGGQAVRLPVLR